MAGHLGGKVALVTGAASGIGRGVAERLAVDGAQVVLGDVDVDGAHAVAATIGADAVALACDVTDEEEVARLCDAAVERFGGLDIAVANAGRGGFGLLTDLEATAWRELIDIDLTGTFLTIKHAGRVMRAGGSIITIASLNATQPAAGMGAYCAAKAGVAMLTRVAAMELGGRGIRVNAVAPGLVETTATAPMWLLPGVVDEFVDNTTLGRFAQPADVAAVVAFLAGDDAGFVSAGLFPVDGGGSTGRYPDLPGALSRLSDGTP